MFLRHYLFRISDVAYYRLKDFTGYNLSSSSGSTSGTFFNTC